MTDVNLGLETATVIRMELEFYDTGAYDFLAFSQLLRDLPRFYDGAASVEARRTNNLPTHGTQEFVQNAQIIGLSLNSPLQVIIQWPAYVGSGLLAAHGLLNLWARWQRVRVASRVSNLQLAVLEFASREFSESKELQGTGTLESLSRILQALNDLVIEDGSTREWG